MPHLARDVDVNISAPFLLGMTIRRLPSRLEARLDTRLPHPVPAPERDAVYVYRRNSDLVNSPDDLGDVPRERGVCHLGLRYECVLLHGIRRNGARFLFGSARTAP